MAIMGRSSWCLFIATILYSVIVGLVGHGTWSNDCEDATYSPTPQASLALLQREYLEKYGPPLETKPNIVTISDISMSSELQGEDVRCGTLGPDVQIGDNLMSGALDDTSFPWIVAVHGNKHFCAGVLLSKQHVLSPAQCISENSKIVLGNKNRKNMTSKTQSRHAAASYFQDAYKFLERAFDIGLINMDKPVEYSDTIRPICLPSSKSQFHHYSCYLTNWGRYDPVKKQLSDNLLVVPAELMDSYECRFRYKLINQELRDSEGCLAFKGKLGDSYKCRVDTGGPLICDVNGRYFVAAMSSQVTSGCTNQLIPDIFTKVSTFESWISETMYIK